MKTRWHSPKLAGLALLAGALGGAHVAQAQAFNDAPPTRADVAKMQAREADDLALLLGLRPAQWPALTAFLQSMLPPPPPGEDRAPGLENDNASSDGFARQLDRMAEDSARRAQEETHRITAARTFYASLDAGQRRAFEAVMRLRHGPGPGLGRGPGRGRGPGPHGPMPGGDGGPPWSGGMPPRP